MSRNRRSRKQALDNFGSGGFAWSIAGATRLRFSMYRAPIGANVKRSLEMQNPPQIVATRADKELKKRCF